MFSLGGIGEEEMTKLLIVGFFPFRKYTVD